VLGILMYALCTLRFLRSGLKAARDVFQQPVRYDMGKSPCCYG
jgi:hypothetical protein